MSGGKSSLARLLLPLSLHRVLSLMFALFAPPISSISRHSGSHSHLHTSHHHPSLVSSPPTATSLTFPFPSLLYLLPSSFSLFSPLSLSLSNDESMMDDGWWKCGSASPGLAGSGHACLPGAPHLWLRGSFSHPLIWPWPLLSFPPSSFHHPFHQSRFLLLTHHQVKQWYPSAHHISEVSLYTLLHVSHHHLSVAVSSNGNVNVNHLHSPVNICRVSSAHLCMNFFFIFPQNSPSLSLIQICLSQ